MSLRASLDKILIAVSMAALVLLPSCASNPDGPGVVNHAPEISNISFAGGLSAIGASTLVVVTAETSDIDGDELSFEWSGDGAFSGAGEQVTWHVPDEYGTLSISCTVSDGIDSDSFGKNVEVGRRFTSADYGEVVGGEVRWDGSDGVPFYILDGSVTIEDAELVVDAGTLIYCGASSGLTLRGGARFEGNTYDDQAVLFTPWAENISSLSYWNGITINSPGMSIEVTGTHIKNAKHGISMLTGTTQTLDAVWSKFEQCEKGIEASQIPVRGEHLSFWECGRGLQATVLDELVLLNCSFYECEEYGIYAGETPGLCTRSQFSGDGKAVFLGSGSRMSMSGNVFSIPDPNPFLTVGGGYQAGADSLDFRCSYWGSDVGSTAQILPRIERDPGAPGLLLDPVADSEFALCGGTEPPAVLSLELRAEGHPLQDQPGWESYEFDLPHNSFPAMQLVLSLENEDQVSTTYSWSSDDDVYFYHDGGIAEDFMGGYFDPTGTYYPAQTGGAFESVIYAVTNETESFTVAVTVEYVSDGEVQSLVHEETVFIP